MSGGPGAACPLGLVVALPAEVRCLGALRGDTVACGVGARCAGRRAEALLGRGAEALVSYGVAGGLIGAAAPGTLVVPRTVHWRARRFLADPALRDGVVAALPDALVGDLVCVERMLLKRADKTALARSFPSGVALDMESGAVAEVAAAAGVPFLAVRAISDGPAAEISEALAGLLGSGGAVAPGAVAGLLARRPWVAAEMLRVGLGFARGLRALRRAAQALASLRAAA